MAALPNELDPGSLDVRIVPMRRRHLRGIMQIEGQVYPRPWSIGLFMSELAMRGGRIYLVARIGTSVVGYAGLMFAGADAHVTNIAVDPQWQRSRIGTRLLLHLSRQAIASGATAMTLEVRVSNEAAQAMYRRFGYVPAGIRKGYYAETNEDALIMWAHDVDTDAYAERLDTIEASIPGGTIVEER